MRFAFCIIDMEPAEDRPEPAENPTDEIGPFNPIANPSQDGNLSAEEHKRRGEAYSDSGDYRNAVRQYS